MQINLKNSIQPEFQFLLNWDKNNIMAKSVTSGKSIWEILKNIGLDGLRVCLSVSWTFVFQRFWWRLKKKGLIKSWRSLRCKESLSWRFCIMWVIQFRKMISRELQGCCMNSWKTSGFQWHYQKWVRSSWLELPISIQTSTSIEIVKFNISFLCFIS